MLGNVKHTAAKINVTNFEQIQRIPYEPYPYRTSIEETEYTGDRINIIKTNQQPQFRMFQLRVGFSVDII